MTVSLGDPIYKAVLPTVFAEGWEKLSKELTIPEAIQEVGPRWTDAMPGLLDDLATEPTTMCHGDWRADNLLFEPDGSVAALDFQLTATARGTYDLAYFVTQSLDRGDATQHEKALFDRWIRAVEAGGAPPEDNATAWEDYRKAALFCLVYPVVAWRGMDAGDPRQVGLATTMLDRFDRAVAELQLAELRVEARADAIDGEPAPDAMSLPGGSAWQPPTLACRSNPHHILRAVAQLAEQRSPKPQVGGSSPSCPAPAVP